MDREKLQRIIFEADTPAGRRYDTLLIMTVVISVLCVLLDSVTSINVRHGHGLYVVEWIFTILFTIDYVTRLACVKRPLRYALSFFGIVDLLGVIPTYLGLIFPEGRYLVTIRFLRVLRVFRVFKLVAYLEEARAMGAALRASAKKITVFLVGVLTMVVVLGSLMYVIEGAQPETGFTSIPRSIYWAIVTLTTVGYGDISPGTPAGQALAAVIMILGYSIIVVPTGIVTVEMAGRSNRGGPCPHCGKPLD